MVVCDGLWLFEVVHGGLWWFVVVYGGLLWFVVVYGGLWSLWWFVVVDGGLNLKFVKEMIEGHPGFRIVQINVKKAYDSVDHTILGKS